MGRKSIIESGKNMDEKLTVLVGAALRDKAFLVGESYGLKNISEVVRAALEGYIQRDKTQADLVRLKLINEDLTADNRETHLNNIALEEQMEIYERTLKAYEQLADAINYIQKTKKEEHQE